MYINYFDASIVEVLKDFGVEKDDWVIHITGTWVNNRSDVVADIKHLITVKPYLLYG